MWVSEGTMPGPIPDPETVPTGPPVRTHWDQWDHAPDILGMTMRAPYPVLLHASKTPLPI